MQNQLNYVQQAYKHIRLCGRRGWWALPSKEDSEGAFSRYMQRPTESFPDFVACLTQAVR